MSPPIKKRALPIVCSGIDYDLLCDRFASNCFVMGIEVITSTLPPTLWLIAYSVAVRLESEATEGCSVACAVRFAAAMVQHNRYNNLSRKILHRFGNLKL